MDLKEIRKLVSSDTTIKDLKILILSHLLNLIKEIENSILKWTVIQEFTNYFQV